MQRNHIHIPFAEDNGFLRVIFRKVHRKNLVGLFIGKGVGGVEVFRLRIIEHSAAEADHPAADINNRDHYPIAEIVIIIAL